MTSSYPSVHITLPDGTDRIVAPHTPVGALLPPADPTQPPVVGALVNNDVVSLSYPLDVDASLRFLTMVDRHGWLVYQRSVCFLLAMAVHDLFPESTLSIDYSVGQGLYCTFDADGGGGPAARGITAQQLDAVGTRMRELAEADLPIERRRLSFTQALDAYERAGRRDRLNLLRFRNPPKVVAHACGEYLDFTYGPLAASTGALSCFQLLHRPPRFLLLLPDRSYPCSIRPYQDQPHQFQIFEEHKEWGRILGVSTVGRLNELIADGDVNAFIRVAEALHEKRVAQIADRIAAHRDRIRVVLIAGPSSAGKTTFSKRLAVQLRVNGLRPATLELDNYFVERAATPRDDDGNYDFEHVDALDLPLINDHLERLAAGESVVVPRFNFQDGSRQPGTRSLSLGPEDILVMEGIHGLNPRLTERIPKDRTFHVYVSALTQLSLDSLNRISTTDNRLLRRIIRDHRYRGIPALTTLQRWPSVHRGENRWIFPFQSRADATFNSALDYEFAVLKPLVEPLLMLVKPSNPEYADARRLAQFLESFLAIPDTQVPRTSILREYIGASSFQD